MTRSREKGKIVLTTARLRLREVELSDLDFVSAMLGDVEVMRHYPKPLSREESRAWIERQQARYEADGCGLWLVEETAAERPVGQVGLLWQNVEGAREPEIGYLLDRSCWKRGFATEAAAAVRDDAFGAHGLRRVVSLIRPENLSSQAVAGRLGMAPEREVVFHGLPHRMFSVGTGGSPRGDRVREEAR